MGKLSRRTRALTAALLALAALHPAPARGDSDPSGWPESWVFGRSPHVFEADERVLATRIGGWVDASYEDNDLPSSSKSINVNHLNLFFDTRYGERWQLFGEGEFENETDLYGYEEEREYELEQLYGRYRFGDALELRVGKFNTPFGYWTPIHWSILMDTIRAPLHVGQRWTPEQQQGISLQGKRYLDKLGPDAELRYTAYAGYGSHGALLEDSRTDGVSAGGDLRLTVQPENFLGVSVYRQERELSPDDRTETSALVYGETTLARVLTLRGEYLHQHRDRHVLAGAPQNLDVTYLKVRWYFHSRAYLNYRINWGDDDEPSDPGAKRTIHTVTLGYQPRPSVRLKLEWADHSFHESTRRDFRYWGASIGTLF